MNSPHLPPDPLRRFLEIAGALRQTRRWTDDWAVLRHSALTLASAGGSAPDLAGRLRETAKVLEKRTGMFGPLRSSIRYVVAAILVREGDDAGDFSAEIMRSRSLFREAGVRRGGISEVLAILVLRMQAPRGHVSASQVSRFQAIYKALRADHPFITGHDDYPACALLCGSTRPPDVIRAGVEALYKELRRRRFRPGEHLQTATHVLFLAGEDAMQSVERFARLWDALRSAGLRMRVSNYYEVALLALLGPPPKEIVRTVLAHRASIQELRPRPDREVSFSLAVGTSFVDLVRLEARARSIPDVKLMIDVQNLIRARQAAVVVAAAAG